MRRGFIFTLDALLSLILVVTVLASVVSIENRVSQVYLTSMRSQSRDIAKEMLMVLRTVPLNEIVPPEKIEEWEDNDPDSDLVDPSMSPLDIVATYWATQNIYPEKTCGTKLKLSWGTS